MEALKLDPDLAALRAAFDRLIGDALEVANLLDDNGKPSMTVDNIRRELITLKARHCTANDNDQPTR